MSHTATVTRNAAWLMAQRVLMSLFSIVVVAVVARYLGTENYGNLVLLLSYNALLSQLSSLGLRPYSVREMAADRGRVVELVEEMFVLRLALSAFVTVAAVLYLHYVDEIFPDALIAILAVQLMTNALGMCFIDGLYGVEAIKAVATAMAASGIAVQVACLAAAVLDAGLIGIAMAYVLGNLVTLAVAWRLLMRQVGGLRLRAFRLDMLAHVKASRTFFLQNLVHTIRQRLDVILITAFLGPHGAGIYGSSLTLVQRLELVQDAMSTALFPRVSSLHGQSPAELKELVRTSFKLTLLISTPMAVGLFGISDEVVRLVFGEQFAEAGPVLALLALAIPFAYIYGLLFNVLTAMKRQDQVFRYSLIALVPGIAVMVAGIKLAGAPGAGAAFGVVIALLALPLVADYCRQMGPNASARDLLGIAAANGVMGTCLWFGSGLHVAVKIPMCAVVFALSILAFRVATPDSLRLLLRRPRAEPEGRDG